MRLAHKIAAALVAMLLPLAAQASFLSPAMVDSAANVLAWFVLIVMPPLGIALFWMVHVLPQKAAEKRHHPQKEAIHVLCLLSLVFGGLLWPIAWLWAYARPTVHAAAHGTEFHEDYYLEKAQEAERGELSADEHAALLEELDGLERRGLLRAQLREARDRLRRVEGGSGTPTAQIEGAA
jgi:CBS domain containing-hemolysin-like protein